MFLSLSEARELAQRKINENAARSNIKLAILDSATLEFEYGWMFFYQSEQYVLTGDLNTLIGGNAPIIVDKINSSIHSAGTRMDANFYIKKYCQYRDSPKEYYMAIS